MQNANKYVHEAIVDLVNELTIVYGEVTANEIWDNIEDVLPEEAQGGATLAALSGYVGTVPVTFTNKSADYNRIGVIKTVRQATHLDLRSTKALCDTAHETASTFNVLREERSRVIDELVSYGCTII